MNYLMPTNFFFLFNSGETVAFIIIGALVQVSVYWLAAGFF